MDSKEVRDAWVRLHVARGRFDGFIEEHDLAIRRLEQWMIVLFLSAVTWAIVLFGPWSFPHWYTSILSPVVGGITGYATALLIRMEVAGRRATRSGDESGEKFQIYRSILNMHLYNPHALRSPRRVSKEA